MRGGWNGNGYSVDTPVVFYGFVDKHGWIV
jgi:hypothetical protein